MNPIDREVLALRHFEELSNSEAAAALGLSKTAASNRYIRALKRLKEILTAIPGIDQGARAGKPPSKEARSVNVPETSPAACRVSIRVFDGRGRTRRSASDQRRLIALKKGRKPMKRRQFMTTALRASLLVASAFAVSGCGGDGQPAGGHSRCRGRAAPRARLLKKGSPELPRRSSRAIA